MATWPDATGTALHRVFPLILEDAIARRIEVTVWHNGTQVDPFVAPCELADRLPEKQHQKASCRFMMLT